MHLLESIYNSVLNISIPNNPLETAETKRTFDAAHKAFVMPLQEVSQENILRRKASLLKPWQQQNAPHLEPVFMRLLICSWIEGLTMQAIVIRYTDFTFLFLNF